MAKENQYRGQCFGCGFFGKRWDAESYTGIAYFQITFGQRQNAQFFRHRIRGEPPLETKPACFKNIANLEEEIGAAQEAIPLADATKRLEAGVNVLLNERDCQGWFPYEPGFGPQAHAEKQAANDLEDRRHACERSMEEGRREWERQMEKDRRAYETKLDEQRRETTNRSNTIIFRLTVAAVALAAAEVFAGIAGLTQDSLIVDMIGKAF